MSAKPVISIQNISKAYKRYHRPIERLKEVLFPTQSNADEFWAVRNVNLEISRGETVGIVGRNGSGKSTLLQMIAGTLQPTDGQLQVNGRVSALLELGSGFNPEFTGRQNAFFNGRILGLSRDYIETKFDAIAAFADIGDFMDQPVKTYSSGMFVRLAFAVAINVDPDILIIDEALSVGDEAFQRKCFARIYELQEKGVTVLFVSHAASSIVELCDRAILIDDGEILSQGIPKVIVAQYQKLIYAPEDEKSHIRDDLKQNYLNGGKAFPLQQSRGFLPPEPDQQDFVERAIAPSKSLYDPYLIPKHRVDYQSRGARIKNPEIKTPDGQLANILCRGEKYFYSYVVYFHQDASQVSFGMLIKTTSGFELGGSTSHPPSEPIEHIPAGTLVNVEFEFPCALLPGTYFLNAGVLGEINGEVIYLDRVIDAVMFKVQPESNLEPTGIIDFGITSRFTKLSTATPA